MKLLRSRRGGMVVGETIKWIIYLAIVVAVGFAIRAIVIKAGS